ncbi:alpha/beta hydrolase [Blastococcus xanthinilyticus]|uniref:Putative esterase n=1 Tax=Blastococcus xanthinilyticus TaxID=1564164 RepID=A0A5S5CQI2_9ACTN|nr:phospholipase [Blastococcus xanthinilyticus]TYP82877.1 putative esterase [Blastococcus xanthinilyticus]
MPASAASGRLDSRPPAAPPVDPWPAGVHALELGGGAEVLLAVPPGEPAPRPLLVFFHGAGGEPAQSLAAVGPMAAERGVLVLAPRSGAATWDLISGRLGRDVAVLDAALAQLGAHVAVSRSAVGGFSDGASYALSLGPANGDLFDAVLAFSPGFAGPPVQVGTPRIWITHGTGDRVLPVDRCGRRLAAAFDASAYAVTYDEFDGGHVVRPEGVATALGWWLGTS